MFHCYPIQTSSLLDSDDLPAEALNEGLVDTQGHQLVHNLVSHSRGFVSHRELPHRVHTLAKAGGNYATNAQLRVRSQSRQQTVSYFCCSAANCCNSGPMSNVRRSRTMLGSCGDAWESGCPVQIANVVDPPSQAHVELTLQTFVRNHRTLVEAHR